MHRLLSYLFGGTGAGEKDSHFGLLADICRLREGDPVLFYLERVGFFGVFRVAGRPFKDDGTPTYLEDELGKKLIYRVMIAPDKVYPRCVSEWEALDKLPEYAIDVIWSLIYRKLKGNRGCTPVTDDEFERLRQLLESAQDENCSLAPGASLTYSPSERRIVNASGVFTYDGVTSETEDVLGQMLCLDEAEYAYEVQLQAFLMQNIGRLSDLQELAGGAGRLVWIANEVSCGVGMQKIDVFTITEDAAGGRLHSLIELKCVPVSPGIASQLERYTLWARSFIRGVTASNVQPVVVSRKVKRRNPWQKPRKAERDRDSAIEELGTLNRRNLALRPRLFEFDFRDDRIVFEESMYDP